MKHAGLDIQFLGHACHGAKQARDEEPDAKEETGTTTDRD